MRNHPCLFFSFWCAHVRLEAEKRLSALVRRNCVYCSLWLVVWVTCDACQLFAFFSSYSCLLRGRLVFDVLLIYFSPMSTACSDFYGDQEPWLSMNGIVTVEYVPRSHVVHFDASLCRKKIQALLPCRFCAHKVVCGGQSASTENSDDSCTVGSLAPWFLALYFLVQIQTLPCK